jgi:hypothetical protein
LIHFGVAQNTHCMQPIANLVAALFLTDAVNLSAVGGGDHDYRVNSH